MHEQRVAGVCTCLPGFSRDLSSSCVPNRCSDPNTRLDPITNECVPLCPTPHAVIGGQCICAQGYEIYNDVCVRQCQAGYTRVRGNCQITCTDDQVLVNGICKCETGTYLINGQCAECPLNSRKVNGECLCYGSGQRAYYSQCPTPTCPFNSYWNTVTYRCECLPPYVKNGNFCQLPSTICPINSFYTGFYCECNYGYYALTYYCARCAGGALTCGSRILTDGLIVFWLK